MIENNITITAYSYHGTASQQCITYTFWRVLISTHKNANFITSESLSLQVLPPQKNGQLLLAHIYCMIVTNSIRY